MSELLLDTHTLLWLDMAPEKLSAKAIALIRDATQTIYVSPISAWEIGIKFEQGKLVEAAEFVSNFYGQLARYELLELPFTSADALRAARLPNVCRDPFDRALVAQAIGLNLPLVSADTLLDKLGVKRIW
jgi:PIN domain nuclease of toxin-antitoxin system